MCHVLPVPDVDVLCPYSVTLWQSKTRFDEEHKPWDAYPPECQGVLEHAYMYDKDTVELTIRGAIFVVDLKRMEQRNKEHPARVRDVRRTQASPMQWFALNPSPPYDCIKFDEVNNTAVEHGTGTRKIDQDAVMVEVMINDKVYLVDKVRHRQFESGEGGGRFRHVVCAPLGLVREMGEDRYARGPLPPTSPMFRRLVEAFESRHPKLETRKRLNEQLEVVGIEYAFSLDRFMMFQHHVRRGRERNADHRVVIAFHGTLEKHHEAITRYGFDTKCIGNNTKNMGWFGKGIYFSEHGFTALGYNRNQLSLLVCLVSLERTFVTPMPEDMTNPYHGKDCEPGYDSHYSPSRKELVAFDPKQMLACFILHLSTGDYFVSSQAQQQESSEQEQESCDFDSDGSADC